MSEAALENPPQEVRPLAELLRLALPTVAQMASYTVMQFLDTWMLTRVGDGVVAATASGNTGIVSFSIISLGMGVLFVVNTLVSQSFGRKDFAECGRFVWQGVWFALFYSLLVLPMLPLARPLFSRLGHEPLLAEMESAYLKIVISAAALKLIATAFGQFLLAVDRASAVGIATVTGVAFNALAAWILIFGKLGVPSMGIIGAAWAQNIGVLVEMLLLIGFATAPTIRRKFHVSDWRLRLADMRTLLKIGIPSGIQISADVLAWAAWGNVVMGIFGTHAMAANNFVFRFMSVSFMPAFGIGIAVTALVGRYIGRGGPEIAKRRADLGFAVAVAYMLGCALLFFVARHQLIGLFTRDPEVLRIGATLLVFAAVYQLFDAMYVIYYGALRGAGDTFIPAMVTATLCWGITVFGGYFVARALPQLGPSGPWIAATIYGAILGVFMIARFRRGGWRRITLHHDVSPEQIASTTVPAAL